jgi:acyl-CoA synthetase (AMP-forming)/AMP-acid ligase II
LFQDAETNEVYTYADIKQSALSFGAGLISKLSWKKGEVLAIFASNSIEWPVVVLGALWAGAVVYWGKNQSQDGSRVPGLLLGDHWKAKGCQALTLQRNIKYQSTTARRSSILDLERLQNM